MYTGKMKKFRDTIHGYIEIPEPIVTNIIDTELFQRLRYIEQTSMRPLYPAARHDRFIHSLGVYWLGKQAFFNFRKNAQKVLAESGNTEIPEEMWWDKQELLFMLACLLHDCAHAPFSHTLESLYVLQKINWEEVKDEIPTVLNKETKLSELDYHLLKIGSKEDSSFAKDFLLGTEKSLECKGVGAPHEKMSAYCVIKEFGQAIDAVIKKMYPEKMKIESSDIVFVSRMIIGCTYSDTQVKYNSLKNCIISMLNSTSIDVDGLDYIVRDAYMSGIDNYSIDYQRLLSSFTIIPVDVYTNCDFDNENLEGIWLKESQFESRRYKAELIEGKMTFEGLEADDVIDIIGDKIEKTDGMLNTKEDSKLSVDLEAAKFLLKESCKLSGQITGKVLTGRRIVDSNTIGCDAGNREYILGFDKNSLSIIQSTIDARNHEYLWIYTHPKVLYSSNYLQWELLRGSAKYLCCCYHNEKFETEKIDFANCKNCPYVCEEGAVSEEDFMLYILGFNTYFDKVLSNSSNISGKLAEKGYIFYRTCDDDLNALFKRIYIENQNRKDLKSEKLDADLYEFFSRNHKKPLWKSFVEYDCFLKQYGEHAKALTRFFKSKVSKASLYKNSYCELQDEDKDFFSKYGMENVVIIKASAKTKQLNPYDTFIKFKNQALRLADVLDKAFIKEKMSKDFYYIFANYNENYDEDKMRELLSELWQNKPS